MQFTSRILNRWLRSVWFFPSSAALIGLAVGLWVAPPIYRQTVAIHQIERSGGHVRFRPVGPYWLREIFGSTWPRILDVVEEVYINDDKFRDPDLVHLSNFSSLKRLSIANTMVRGTGFKHLTELQNLEVLNAHDSRIDDVGAAELANLKTLKVVDLSSTPIRDAGVAHLASLPNLEVLNLGGTKVGNNSLVEIPRFRNLTWLQLDGTRVTSRGTENLRGLSKLKVLRLNARRVSPEARAELRRTLPGVSVYP